MNYTHSLAHVLHEYENTVYKMILLKVIAIDGNFSVSNAVTTIIVDDGTNQVANFMFRLTGNRKEMHAYFTTDAFDGHNSSSTISINKNGVAFAEISGVDVTNIPVLPAYVGATPHVDADNDWLTTQ